MNRNTRGNYNIARQQAAKGAKAVSFDIPKVLSGRGESADWGNYGKKTFHFENSPRKSQKPKVAAKGKKTRQEIEQEEIDAVAKEVIQEIEKEKRQ